MSFEFEIGGIACTLPPLIDDLGFKERHLDANPRSWSQTDVRALVEMCLV